MNGPLDSPRVAPRRRTLACLGLLAAGAAMLGCGSEEEPSDRSVSTQAAEEITAKLELIDTRFTDNDCEGAEEALTNLREDVPDVDANQTFRDELSSLLEDLDSQLAEECSTSSDETTTSSSTKDEDTTETDSTTEPVPTETTSTEEEPSTTEDEEPPPTDEEEEPATPDPPDPPADEPAIPPATGGTGGGGSDPSGGVTPPAFESGRKAAG